MSFRCRSVTQADDASPKGIFKMKRAQRNTVCAVKDLKHSAIEELKSAQKMRKRQEDQKRLLGMLGQLPFFQQFGQEESDVIHRCSLAMNLEVFQPNEIVFQIDSLGDKFYLILEGEVEVFAKKPENCTSGSFRSFAMKMQKRTKNNFETDSSHLTVKGTLESIESISSFSLKESKNSIDGDLKDDEDQSSGKKDQLRNSYVKEHQEIGEENEGIKQSSDNNISICSPTTPKNTSFGQKKDKSISSSISHTIPNDHISDNSTYQTKSTACFDSNNNKLLLVKTLQVGQSFGEIALIYSRPRLATVRCLSKCVLAVLSKKQYALILQEEEAKRITKFTDELKLVPIFSNWSFEGLKEIYLNSHSLNFKKGQVVFAAGDISDAVYIVRNGEFNMKKVLQLPPIIIEESNQIQGSNDNGCEKLLLKQCSPQKQQKQREFTIMKMCVCEMFGEEDVVSNTSRGYTVECASLTGQLLVIKSSDFINRIVERSEMLREYVLERMETKRDYAEKTEKNFKSQFSKFRHFLVEDRTEQPGTSQQNRQSPISNFKQGFNKNLKISDNSQITQQNYPVLEKRSCSTNGRVNQKNSDKIVFNPSDNNLKNNEGINKSGCFSRSLSQYEESQNLTSPLQRNNSINRNKSNSTNEGLVQNENNQESGTQNNNIIHSNVEDIHSKSKDRAIQFSSKNNQKNENDINSFSFFEIKVSKRQTIKMANKYEYYNYLQQNGSDERFLIPIKRTLNNVVFNKPPLLLSVLSNSPVAVALNRNNSPIIHKNIMNLQNSIPIVVKQGEQNQEDGQDQIIGKDNDLTRNEDDKNYERNHKEELSQIDRPLSEKYTTPKREQYHKRLTNKITMSTSPSDDRQNVNKPPKKKLFLKSKLEPSLSPPKFELKFPQISFLTPQVNSKKEKLNNIHTDPDNDIDSFFKKSVFRDAETRNLKRIAYLRRAPQQIEFMIGNSERF